MHHMKVFQLSMKDETMRKRKMTISWTAKGETWLPFLDTTNGRASWMPRMAGPERYPNHSLVELTSSSFWSNWILDLLVLEPIPLLQPNWSTNSKVWVTWSNRRMDSLHPSNEWWTTCGFLCKCWQCFGIIEHPKTHFSNSLLRHT